MIQRQMARRVYTYESGAVQEALRRAPELFGVAAEASEPKKLEAAVAYAVRMAEAENDAKRREGAYAVLAADNDRYDRIRRNAKARAAEGLL